MPLVIRRTSLRVVGLIAFSILLTAKLVLALISHQEQYAQAHAAFDSLVAVNHAVNANVLRSRAFILHNYDPIVLGAEQMRLTCNQLKASRRLDVSEDKKFRSSLLTYCQAVEAKAQAIEQFKSSHSLYRNSVKYLPTVAAQLTGTRSESEARKLVAEILYHGMSPDANYQRLVYEQANRLRATATASTRPLVDALVQHSELAIKAYVSRKSAEEDILSTVVEQSHTEMVRAYSEWAARRATRHGVGYASFALLSALPLGAVLWFVKRLEDARANLESRVRERTRQLSDALSELKEKQQMLVQATKITALGEMAGGIAHEVNTPLGSILLNAELALELIDGEKQPDLRDINQSIIKTVSRISKIISGLRRFARDTGKDEKMQIALDSVVSDTLDLCEQKMKSHGVRMTVQLGGHAPVMAVPEQLSQVLLNLLNNAYDAVTELPDSKDRWIQIETVYVSDRIQLSVTNGGPAIPPHVQQRLWQPFFTTKPVGKGVGLGLSISKGIAEEHGGKLFYDTKSVHPRFVIELPLVREQAAA